MSKEKTATQLRREARAALEALRDAAAKERQTIAGEVRKTHAQMRALGASHATPDLLADAERKVRSARAAELRREYRAILDHAETYRGTAESMADRVAHVQRSGGPRPWQPITVPDRLTTYTTETEPAAATKYMVKVNRQVYDAIERLRFEQGLPRKPPAVLHALARDAAQENDADRFGIVYTELFSRPGVGKDRALDAARSAVGTLLEAMPLPEDAAQAVEDINVIEQCADEVGQSVQAVGSGDERQCVAEGARLSGELGGEAFGELRHAQRAEREGTPQPAPEPAREPASLN